MSTFCPSETRPPHDRKTPGWIEGTQHPVSGSRSVRQRRSWEGTPAPGIRSWIIAASLVVVVATLFGLVAHQFEATQAFFAENGPVELLQAGILVAVVLVFLGTLRRSSDARALFCLFVAYVLILVIAREIPRCDSVSYLGGVCLSGTSKNGVAIVASLAAIFALVCLPIAWKAALALSNFRWVWPMVLIAAIVGFGEVAESADLPEIEEFLELAAYLCLACFGLQILRRARVQVRR